MTSFNKEETVGELLEITEMAISTSNFSKKKDLEIIYGLLECCETANNLPNKRRRTEWVKPWRQERDQKGSFYFLTKELTIDKTSFFEYLRMSEETFNYILAAIKCDLIKQDTQMRKSISPEEKLAATLRYLATGESLKSISYQTRLSPSHLCAAVPDVCNAIWKHFKKEYLKFPTTVAEWESIAENFAIKWQFPHCLGALDGKHIVFKSLKEDGAFYHNYKGTNSIVLLALVDANCRFIYIDVGCNGRTHDAGVLLQSDLMTVINNADKNFPPEKIIGNGRKLPFVIVGDDAFPLQKHIMKPYSYNTNVTGKKIFNMRITRARHVVEHAFGILTNRFRIFQQKINSSVDNVELYTKTCCLLHNLLSHKTDTYFSQQPSIDCTASEINVKQSQNAKGVAQSTRQAFEDYFNKEGKLDWQDLKL